MKTKKSFEFLEHTADVYIAAYGKNIAEAFENAALAMFEVMTDVKSVRPQVKDSAEIAAQDEYALLYSWLEALLVKFELNEMLYSKFNVQSLSRTTNGFELKADVWGEKFDPKRHVQKVGIKAATYHQMEIIKKPRNVIVKFILDI